MTGDIKKFIENHIHSIEDEDWDYILLEAFIHNIPIVQFLQVLMKAGIENDLTSAIKEDENIIDVITSIEKSLQDFVFTTLQWVEEHDRSIKYDEILRVSNLLGLDIVTMPTKIKQFLSLVPEGDDFIIKLRNLDLKELITSIKVLEAIPPYYDIDTSDFKIVKILK